MPLAAAGAPTLQQRGQHAAVGVHAGGDVGDRQPALADASGVPVTDTKPDSLWISRS
jgi:hypothetical protein